MILEAAVLVGLWIFEDYSLKPQIKAPTNSERVEYEFSSDGTSRLFWEIGLQNKFCERQGKFQFIEGQIEDEILVLNPNSDESCTKDPDMVVGQKTITPARIEGEYLILTLGLGEEQIEMRFKKKP